MAETKDFSQFKDKRVVVTRNLKEPNEKGEGAVEIEGYLEAWNADMGALVKPKGKVQLELIPADEIEDVRELTDAQTKLKRSKLQPVKEGQARRHLLERHGFTLAQVNALTEDQAMKVHDEIDHEANDLGHVHVAESDNENTGDSEPAGDQAA